MTTDERIDIRIQKLEQELAYLRELRLPPIAVKVTPFQQPVQQPVLYKKRAPCTDLLFALEPNGGSTVDALARSLNLPRKPLAQSLQKMRRGGLARSERRKGKTSVWYLTPLGLVAEREERAKMQRGE